jgi:hypothetical protein
MKIGKITTERLEFEDNTSQVTAGGAGQPYVLPPASNTVLGGVKQGTNISITSDGTISSIPPGQLNSDWEAVSGPAQIFNKPIIPSVYSLPVASSSVLGGVKVDGTTVTVNGSGVISSINGTAKAWVEFWINAGVPSIDSSFNVSSITDNGTGDWTINFISALPTNGRPVACTSSHLWTGDARTIIFGLANESSGGVWPPNKATSVRVQEKQMLAGGSVKTEILGIYCVIAY